MDGSSSVLEVYLRRDTVVSGAFLQRRKKPHIQSCSHGSESCVGRHETSFLDFWSTSSALYASDEGPKDAGTVPASFKPSSGS